MKTHVFFDESNAKYEAARMVMDELISFAGFEPSDFNEAKLVIIYAVVSKENVMQILNKYYTPEKFYIVFCLKQSSGIRDLPSNIWWLGVDMILDGGCFSLIKEEAKHFEEKIALVQEKASHLEVPVENIAGMSWMQILVVDDCQSNRDSAKKLLCAHNLTIASSYAQAMELLSAHEFNVVLTDLYLPVSSYHGAYDVQCRDIGRQIPYGFLIANEAKRKGSLVAIVTDSGHHSDPLSAAFDEGGDKAGIIYDNGKNWKMALERLLS